MKKKKIAFNYILSDRLASMIHTPAWRGEGDRQDGLVSANRTEDNEM